MERVAVERLQVGEYGQATDYLGDEAIRAQVLGSDIAQIVLLVAQAGTVAVGGIAHHVAVEAVGNLLLDALKGAAAYKEDILGVDGYHLLLGVLASALWGHVDDRAFEQLEQALLHTLARYVAGDGWVVALACNLIYLVDEYDAPLGLVDVVVGGLEQAGEQALDVLAHISGLGEHGGVDDGEGHVEHTGYGAGEQSLAGAGGADDDDVALLDIDIIGAALLQQTLVVVVDGHGEKFLSLLLPDDILVEATLDLVRGRELAVHLAGKIIL